jgi:predicted acetyltransferase
VERLWQLYWHDLSEFRRVLPDADGLFPDRLLAPYRDNPDCRGYLIEDGGPPLGFVFVGRLAEGPRLMSEFFVVRAARRTGVGYRATLDPLNRHPGRWEIPFQEENQGAARFWRHAATAVAGDTWTEERRPVPGKPHLPHDVWITLDA